MKPASVRITALVALALCAAPAARAAEPGWYVGGSAGPSRAKIDDQRITDGLRTDGFVTTSIANDERDIGYKIFGGYQINTYLAVEGGYFDLGRFSFKANTIPAGTLDGRIKVRGAALDLVGTVPLFDRLSAFGRVGATYAQTRDDFSGSGAVIVTNPNPRVKKANYKFGVGLQYAFTESLVVRAEAERYRVNDAVGNKGDVDLLSVGLVYRFGAKTPAPAPRVAAPPLAPPIAAAPPPPPPPPPLPPSPPSRVTFSADSLFDFDRATIKPSGTQSLDRFAADLNGTRYDRVTVTGHTDRLGPHPYNLALSAKRAEAVKAYLVRSGIAADRIEAHGVDGSNPVTQPGACPGKQPTARLIACLQPDRRVEVEVSGTK